MVACCLAGLVLGAATPASAVPIISVSSPTSVTNNSVFTVDILISGVTDLFFFQFAINWDPSVLSAVQQQPGSILLNADPGQQFIDPGHDNFLGEIFYFDTLIGPIPGASGNGTLLSVTFLALLPPGVMSGVSPISVNFNTPDGGGGLFDSNFQPILPSSITNASVTVSVPEASTLSLFAMGLTVIAIASLWRRRVGTLRP
jgi:hypothetical protein